MPLVINRLHAYANDVLYEIVIYPRIYRKSRYIQAFILKADVNYRNPDQNPAGPWCFTYNEVDDNALVSSCNIPLCEGRLY